MADMIRVRVVSVEARQSHSAWVIGEQETHPDGSTQMVAHMVPLSSFYNHPAEYGLDPADSRSVLDMLLHSRFEQSAHDPVDPHSPYRTTPALAWAHRTSIIDEIKQTVSIEDPDGLLEQIHQMHVPHPRAVHAARDRVRAARAAVAVHDQVRQQRTESWPHPHELMHRPADRSGVAPVPYSSGEDNG